MVKKNKVQNSKHSVPEVQKTPEVLEEKMSDQKQILQRISEEDRLSLDLAKLKREKALTEAKLALSENEKAELSFKYTVLSLYRKYNLSDADALKDDGEIVYGGALAGTGV